MGILFPDVINLLEARRGRSGGKAITLGRLSVYLHGSELAKCREEVGNDAIACAWFNDYSWGDLADGLFRDVLKFDVIDSLDFSTYQGATVIHDLGQPLPRHLMAQYDLAFDGGTLEHVFDFPTAIKNLMNLVNSGGLAYWHGPCNNLCGHGFYQFSPELAFRIFSEANGFKALFVRLATSRQISIERTSNHPVYEVMDPKEARQRISLVTRMPVSIMVLAQRIQERELFRENVLQSDYVVSWAAENNTLRNRSDFARKMVRRLLPSSWREWLAANIESRKASLRYRRYFKRLR